MSASRGRTVLITRKRCFNALLLAFCLPAAAADNPLDRLAGKALFEKLWVPAPASTGASDGLGPYYNARSCAQCHPGGGKGERDVSLVFHIDDPVYGSQLQKFALPGLQPEARVDMAVAAVDQDTGLIAPAYEVTRLSQGELANGALSPRMAPALQGLGLLEAIPDAVIAARADPADSDGDGISGRVNPVTEAAGNAAVGRFGWKASRASLRDQVARALSQDLGLGNPLYPSPHGDCTAAQAQCLAAPGGNSPQHDNLEAGTTVLDLLLMYVRSLQAPLRLDSPDPARAARGEAAFTIAGCPACHLPAIAWGDTVVTAYTDLLLHDMGPGLADGLGEGVALGGEWRTAPLWGLGRVLGEYLHDGRATTLDDAIRWHDGEAAVARRHFFQTLDETQRRDLIVFLNSL